MSKKPETFNYQDYLRTVEECKAAHAENLSLRAALKAAIQENEKLRAELEAETIVADEYCTMLMDLCNKCSEVCDSFESLAGITGEEESQHVMS